MTAPRGLRIWCEMVTHAEITSPAVLAALAQRKIGLIVAAQPGPRADLVRLAQAARDAGLSFAIWPMLTDAAGRWASVDNAARFASYVHALVDELDAAGALPDEVALDLEPPIDRLRRMLGLDPPARSAPPPDDGEAILGALVRDLRARVPTPIRVSAAVIPLVLLDDERSGLERWLGTPVGSIAWDHTSVMVYTTLIEGYSRGLLTRNDVRPLLASACRLTASRFGARAGVSLGAVGKGALGDEATYRSAAELADDVAIARAAGIEDLTLFDLGGVLRRPPWEAWLDAFTCTAPAPRLPEATWKSRATEKLGRGASRSLGAFGSLRRTRG
ncbi:hypothetical protein [Polyangium mundeleinium]|uniref:Uncharacterized protein n=1 Tax=Polyangium mundeleinium TaxID=2995306 RepID=A0ABT5ETE7_9BACT|nr:hypothetical protein [Polyangium mundeleinium]MDC0745099.1 hypothetical protein [Polyangium mundeleinium]